MSAFVSSHSTGRPSARRTSYRSLSDAIISNEVSAAMIWRVSRHQMNGQRGGKEGRKYLRFQFGDNAVKTGGPPSKPLRKHDPSRPRCPRDHSLLPALWGSVKSKERSEPNSKSYISPCSDHSQRKSLMAPGRDRELGRWCSRVARGAGPWSSQLFRSRLQQLSCGTWYSE